MRKSKNVPECPDKIMLNDEELVQLKEYDKKLAELKCQLADIYVKKCSIDSELTTVTDNINKVKSEYINIAKTLAKNHGVDLDMPNQGNWNLDLVEKTLFKVS